MSENEVTIKEAKEHAEVLERRIEELVREFAQLTGLAVEDIEIDSQLTMGGSSIAVVRLYVVLPS